MIANHRELFVLGLFTFYIGIGALESTQVRSILLYFITYNILIMALKISKSF